MIDEGTTLWRNMSKFWTWNNHHCGQCTKLQAWWILITIIIMLTEIVFSFYRLIDRQFSKKTSRRIVKSQFCFLRNQSYECLNWESYDVEIRIFRHSTFAIVDIDYNSNNNTHHHQRKMSENCRIFLTQCRSIIMKIQQWYEYQIKSSRLAIDNWFCAQ